MSRKMKKGQPIAKGESVSSVSRKGGGCRSFFSCRPFRPEDMGVVEGSKKPSRADGALVYEHDADDTKGLPIKDEPVVIPEDPFESAYRFWYRHGLIPWAPKSLGGETPATVAHSSIITPKKSMQIRTVSPPGTDKTQPYSPSPVITRRRESPGLESISSPVRSKIQSNKPVEKERVHAPETPQRQVTFQSTDSGRVSCSPIDRARGVPTVFTTVAPTAKSVQTVSPSRRVPPQGIGISFYPEIPSPKQEESTIPSLERFASGTPKTRSAKEVLLTSKRAPSVPSDVEAKRLRTSTSPLRTDMAKKETETRKKKSRKRNLLPWTKLSTKATNLKSRKDVPDVSQIEPKSSSTPTEPSPVVSLESEDSNDIKAQLFGRATSWRRRYVELKSSEEDFIAAVDNTVRKQTRTLENEEFSVQSLDAPGSNEKEPSPVVSIDSGDFYHSSQAGVKHFDWLREAGDETCETTSFDRKQERSFDGVNFDHGPLVSESDCESEPFDEKYTLDLLEMPLGLSNKCAFCNKGATSVSCIFCKEEMYCSAVCRGNDLFKHTATCSAKVSQERNPILTGDTWLNEESRGTTTTAAGEQQNAQKCFQPTSSSEIRRMRQERIQGNSPIPRAHGSPNMTQSLSISPTKTKTAKLASLFGDVQYSPSRKSELVNEIKGYVDTHTLYEQTAASPKETNCTVHQACLEDCE